MIANIPEGKPPPIIHHLRHYADDDGRSVIQAENVATHEQFFQGSCLFVRENRKGKVQFPLTFRLPGASVQEAFAFFDAAAGRAAADAKAEIEKHEARIARAPGGILDDKGRLFQGKPRFKA